MRKLFTTLFLLSFVASFGQRMHINGTGLNATINKAGESHTVQLSEIFAPQMFPIEYKASGPDYASAIVIHPEGGTVDYDYLDYAGNVIASASISMNTRRPLQLIKNDVFTSLTLTDLQPGSFAESAENTLYIAFGNLVNLGWPDFAWSGRHGTTHVLNGEKATLPYSSLTRTFGTRQLVTPRADPQEVRGGSHTVIGNQIYFFSSLYTEVADSFTCMVLTKSTDLTGTSWNADDTLLWYPDQHGGINETTYKRFNFYGDPVNIPGTQTWFVPWFEHLNSAIWRVNALYTEDNFATYETRNFSTSVGSIGQVGEPSLTYCGNNTLLMLGRFDLNVPLYQNISYDLGVTWEGWQRTNMGSSQGRVMAAVLHTEEFGLIAVYGDRGTDNIMMSKNNNLADIAAFPLTWSTPEIIYTVTSVDSFEPLGYPSIIRVAQSRYMIAFSKENSAANARLLIRDGKP